MIRLQVSVNSLELIGKLQKSLIEMDMAPILDDAGAFVLNRIRTRFLGERDPEDRSWTPSKAALKRRAEGGTGTLFDTGRLFHSIQYARLDDTTSAVATDVPYAPYLHFGFRHWKSGAQVGPWPFMGITQSDAGILEKLLAQRLGKLIEVALA